ncbi:MAG TPA: GNAT family N-acetyltransferase [Candidatus Saccharimonadales bacterium]
MSKPTPDKQLEIHKTALADVEKIRRLQAAVWRVTYPNDEHGVSAEWVQQETQEWLTTDALDKSKKFLGDILASSDHFHEVAYNGTKAVGFIHGSRINGNQRLDGLYIHPSYHGKGLAQRFVDDLLSWFDQSKDIVLEVASYNERAKAFYAKYGFREWYKEDEKFKGVIPSTKMIRKGVDNKNENRPSGRSE